MRRPRLYQPPRETIPFNSSIQENQLLKELQKDDEPEIYSFADYANTGLRFKGYRELSVVDRARTLHMNRACPHCGIANVEPLELDDAVMSRNFLPIPGTATLVGFHCNDCHSEWSGESA